MEARIGESAGKVWQALKTGGAMNPQALSKSTGLSSDLLNQAVGWLAREGKLTAVKTAKGEQLKLK